MELPAKRKLCHTLEHTPDAHEHPYCRHLRSMSFNVQGNRCTFSQEGDSTAESTGPWTWLASLPHHAARLEIRPLRHMTTGNASREMNDLLLSRERSPSPAIQLTEGDAVGYHIQNPGTEYTCKD
jgi:hypothetical protein